MELQVLIPVQIVSEKSVFSYAEKHRCQSLIKRRKLIIGKSNKGVTKNGVAMLLP
jgi:hypothetical protein